MHLDFLWIFRLYIKDRDMAQQTKRQTPPPADLLFGSMQPKASGRKSTLPQGVTALQTWLEDHGWERHQRNKRIIINQT